MTAIRLQPDKVVETVETLERRIGERFPASGLHALCGRLVEVARESGARSESANRPILWLRVGIGALVALLLGGIALTATAVEVPKEPVDLATMIQVLEAGINDVVFVGIAIAFLATIETRIKRHRALVALRDLRAMAHIIDMHQLTKDPGRRDRATDTASSPTRNLSPFQLRRYLDYCSEMLAIIGKIGAFYAQGLDDEVVLVAVNEVEDLTTGLSQKIWQKIVVLDQYEDAAERRNAAPAPHRGFEAGDA